MGRPPTVIAHLEIGDVCKFPKAKNLRVGFTNSTEYEFTSIVKVLKDTGGRLLFEKTDGSFGEVINFNFISIEEPAEELIS